MIIYAHFTCLVIFSGSKILLQDKLLSAGLGQKWTRDTLFNLNKHTFAFMMDNWTKVDERQFV